jgi:hypothetical protein
MDQSASISCRDSPLNAYWNNATATPDQAVEVLQLGFFLPIFPYSFFYTYNWSVAAPGDARLLYRRRRCVCLQHHLHSHLHDQEGATFNRNVLDKIFHVNFLVMFGKISANSEKLTFSIHRTVHFFQNLRRKYLLFAFLSFANLINTVFMLQAGIRRRNLVFDNQYLQLISTSQIHIYNFSAVNYRLSFFWWLTSKDSSPYTSKWFWCDYLNMGTIKMSHTESSFSAPP